MFSKCQFLCKSMAFAGHIVSSKGIQVDSQKIEEAKNWPRPKMPIEIRNFLGLAIYYKRIIEGFSFIASLLTMLT